MCDPPILSRKELQAQPTELTDRLPELGQKCHRGQPQAWHKEWYTDNTLWEYMNHLNDTKAAATRASTALAAIKVFLEGSRMDWKHLQWTRRNLLLPSVLRKERQQ